MGKCWDYKNLNLSVFHVNEGAVIEDIKHEMIALLEDVAYIVFITAD